MFSFNSSEYIEFLPDLFLKRGKIHQIMGSARFILALIIARTIKDQITWIRLEKSNEMLYPEGLLDWITLNELIIINTQNEKDSFWVMEESLKSGVSPLVLCQLNKIPRYLNLRRLTLSLKKLKDKNRNIIPPTGIILSSFECPIYGVESRWSINRYPSSRNLYETDRIFLEDNWSLICNKSPIVESSWILTSRKFLNGRRIIEVSRNS